MALLYCLLGTLRAYAAAAAAVAVILRCSQDTSRTNHAPKNKERGVGPVAARGNLTRMLRANGASRLLGTHNSQADIVLDTGNVEA